MASVAAALGWAGLPIVLADPVPVEPKGEYAKIDVKLANETIKSLGKGSAEEKQKAVEQIKKSPEKYAPPVFYALSKSLFEDGKNDDAAFWFYAGQLRARFDANRCADVPAREAVAILNGEYGPAINQYSFRDLSKLEKLIHKVVEWDRKTKHDYDHRWINLHGLDAMIEGLGGDDAGGKPSAMSLPEKQWEEIAEKTRAEYLGGIKKAIAEISGKSEVPGGPDYSVEKQRVLYQGREVAGADASTFRPLSNRAFGVDSRNVYVLGCAIPGADPRAFRVIGGPYGRDASAVFCGTVRMSVRNIERFEVVLSDGTWEECYDKRDFVFTWGEVFENVTVSEKTPAVVGKAWARDGASYYHGPTRVAGADYASFRVKNCYQANDKNGEFTGAFRTDDWPARRQRILGIK
jgi:hypothetical protein